MSKILIYVFSLVGIIAPCAAGNKSIDENDEFLIGSLVQLVHSASLWRDTCSDLYSDDETMYREAFEDSFLWKFSRLYKYDESFRDPSMLRSDRLKSLGQTELAAQKWCNEQYFSFLNDVNKKYGQRYQEIESYFNESFKRYNRVRKSV